MLQNIAVIIGFNKSTTVLSDNIQDVRVVGGGREGGREEGGHDDQFSKM